jgi:uncharacterized membrane protein
MSVNKTDDAVSEYLHEVGLRLGGLPLLQRRELLADLEAHIANERAERNVQSEGEVLEILERLGSPEVVAAAAYQEAGPPPPIAPPPTAPPARMARRPATVVGLRRWWPAVVAVAIAFMLLLVLVAGLALARAGGDIARTPDVAPVRVGE